MQHFVNREEELRFVEEKFNILLEKNDLIRIPIIEFHGVGGIGKTTMLKKIEKRCHDMHLPSVWQMPVKAFSIFREILSSKYRNTTSSLLRKAKICLSNLFMQPEHCYRKDQWSFW